MIHKSNKWGQNPFKFCSGTCALKWGQIFTWVVRSMAPGSSRQAVRGPRCSVIDCPLSSCAVALRHGQAEVDLRGDWRSRDSPSHRTRCVWRVAALTGKLPNQLLCAAWRLSGSQPDTRVRLFQHTSWRIEAAFAGRPGLARTNRRGVSCCILATKSASPTTQPCNTESVNKATSSALRPRCTSSR